MKKIKEHFGIDIDEDIRNYSEKDRLRLIELIAQYKVLRWQGQDLTAQEYVRFSRIFGDLWTNDNADLSGGNGESYAHLTGFPEITRVSNRGNGVLGDSRVGWHSDLAHKPANSPGGTNPVRILYAVNIPTDTETVTKWVDCEFAYDRLSDELKELAHKLSVVCIADYTTNWKSNLMPFVSCDPYTGRLSLKLERIFFLKFANMSEPDSIVLMRQFLDHALVDSNIIRHTWRVGDVVLSNNYNTIHEREHFTTNQERTLWRTTFQIPELVPKHLEQNFK